jgi:endosialidase-like protein
MGTLTTSVRFTKPTIGGDAAPLWPTELNSDWDYADQAINQQVSIPVADVNVTLTADGGSSDQARYLTYVFTGALTANRTATLPANVKTGWAINNTSGGFAIVLSAGGTTINIPNDAIQYFFYCDGSNISFQSVGFANLKASGTFAASGQVRIGSLNNLNPANALLTVENTTGIAAQFLDSANVAGATTMTVANNRTDGNAIGFLFGSTAVGSITQNGTTTSYNTTSDERLKISDGRIPYSWATEIIEHLVPRMFRWKAKPQAPSEPGFFAQEVAPVYEWAVREGIGDDVWQMDASKLMPVVVAAMQAIRSELDTARREIRSLRSRMEPGA